MAGLDASAHPLLGRDGFLVALAGSNTPTMGPELDCLLQDIMCRPSSNLVAHCFRINNVFVQA